MKFKVGDKVEFRNGTPCRIIADDLKGVWPLVIAAADETGAENLSLLYADGRVQRGKDSPYDVVKVPDIRVSYFAYRRNPSGGVTLGGYFSDTVEETRRLLKATWDGVAKVTTTDGALSSIEIIE